MDAESVKEKYCSTREAAKMLGVSLTTAQVMVEEGHLKAWKTAGGHRRISIDSVKSMLQNRESGGSISSKSSDDYTVLIAEDDEALCKLYMRTFSSWKLPIKLITVNNGMEAMVLVERMRPSLLILDLGMPNGMNVNLKFGQLLAQQVGVLLDRLQNDAKWLIAPAGVETPPPADAGGDKKLVH